MRLELLTYALLLPVVHRLLTISLHMNKSYVFIGLSVMLLQCCLYLFSLLTFHSTTKLCYCTNVLSVLENRQK